MATNNYMEGFEMIQKEILALQNLNYKYKKLGFMF